MKLKAGDYLVISQGDYSDYIFSGPYRILKDFEQDDVIDACRASFEPKRLFERPNANYFTAWLVKEGYIEDLENCHIWHVDDDNGRLSKPVGGEDDRHR